MQLNLVNFLFGTTFGGAAAANGEGAGGDLFSQLLGNGADQGAQGQNAQLKAADIAVNALVAQEVNPQQLALLQTTDNERLSQLLTQKIGPQEARGLLQQLDAMGQSGENPLNDQAMEQLQEALETIEATGETIEVADLLDTLPAVAETTEPTERAPLMQRMLNWMQTAMDRQKDAATQQAAPQPANSNTPDGLAAGLQASLFRPGDDVAAATAPQTDDEIRDQASEDAAETVTQITPTAQTMLVAMPEWIRKLGDAPAVSTPANDDGIAPLALNEPAQELPEITLPGAKDVADAPVNAKPATAHETKAAPAFSEHLRPLSQALDETQAVSAPVTEVEGTPSLHSFGAHGSSTHTNGVNATHNAASAAYVPHVPVSEQVHLAITQATKDGIDHITLQLDPADLGRVEVKMDVAADGKAQLSFMVDKPETLDALSRDARSLERALQEAGVKADSGSMQFNLRQQPQPQFGTDAGGQGSGKQAANDNDISASAAASAVDGMTNHYIVNVREGVDIQA